MLPPTTDAPPPLAIPDLSKLPRIRMDRIGGKPTPKPGKPLYAPIPSAGVPPWVISAAVVLGILVGMVAGKALPW